MKKIILSLFFVFSALAAFTLSAEVSSRPKYVFLFIGDGLSIPQRMNTEEFLKRTAQTGLLINKLPRSAATTTSSANSFITDSAAAGTAIACGEKTCNWVLGMSADGKRKLESIAEVAKSAGKKVAIISSVTLDHATPAAFYAKQRSRASVRAIAKEALTSRFDYFGGGGFSGRKGKGSDTADIYDMAEKAGFAVFGTKAEAEKFLASSAGRQPLMVVNKNGALPYAIDRGENDFDLADFVSQAIKHCYGDAGFFIMAEGGAIDWLCHSNDAGGTVREVIDFDNAVKVAYEFYLKHPKETLIVVTGDHETGGMTLGFAGTGYESFIELLANQKASGAALSSEFQKLFAEKPVDIEGFKKLVTGRSGLIFARGKRGLYLTAAEEKNLVELAEAANHRKAASTVIRLLCNKSSIGWTTGAHTALPVLTSAVGVGADNFSNMIDNTDIAKIMKVLVK